MSLLIAGTAALDTVETPFGRKEKILGGSALHAAVAASFFVPVSLLSIIGEDFPAEHLGFLQSRNIDTKGLKRAAGKTFAWEGYYEYDMNQAHTRDTRLNSLLDFDTQLSADQTQAEFVFLANLDPDLQLKIISQLKKPKFIAADTMNFWIENKRKSLHEVIKKVDYILLNEGEARQFMETPNIPLAARRFLDYGVKGVIIKQGEHGAVLFTPDFHFSAGSYPQEDLRDPTGAGDSFAGGFMGYLAKTKDFNEENIRRAIIFGSVMASFNVEDFSMDRLKRLKQKEIIGRFEEFRKFSAFEADSVVFEK